MRSLEAGHSAISLFALALILSCCLLLANTPSALAQSSPPDEITAAAAAERAGHYDEAVRQYRSFLASPGPSAPPSARIEVRTRLATDLFMLHRYQESVDAIEPVFSKSGGTAGVADQKRSRPQETIPAQAYVVRGLDKLQLAKPGDRGMMFEATDSLRRALQLNPESGTARMALGDALARGGHLEDAAGEYREQSRRTPDLADAWYKLGVVYTDLAQRTAEQLARDNPKSDLAIQLAAERLYEAGAYLAAAQALFHAVHRSDSSGPRIPPGLHASFGAALIQIGYVHAAEGEFTAELSNDPASLPARLGMVEVNALKSNWAVTLNDLQQLMIAYPDELARQLESAPGAAFSKASQTSAPPANLAESPAGKLWTAWLGSSGLESAAQFIPSQAAGGIPCSTPPSKRQREPGYWLSEGCAAQLLRDLKSKPEPTVNVRVKLAETEYRLEDFDASRASALALLKLAPGNPWGRYWLAKSYAALAGQCFGKLAKVSPKSARVDEILARYHSVHQQLAAARSEYQAALRLEPNLPDLHLGLGTVYWQSGDWTSAEIELKKALELSPESPVAAYELGDSYLQQHQWRQAAEYLPRALSDRDVARKARLDLAKAKDELGDHAAAIRTLLLLVKDDQDGEIYYRLATAYRETGDTAKAQAALARSETLRKSSDQLSIQKLENQWQGVESIGSAPPHDK